MPARKSDPEPIAKILEDVIDALEVLARGQQLTPKMVELLREDLAELKGDEPV